PMKGTARRGRWLAEDDAAAQALAESEKERAENVMIVDLLRNDLGRIARTGTVRVRDLFRVERHPTVLQMTSVVEAELAPRTSLADIFAALFPCGSVTGAPKIAAMEMIARLEDAPRGAYCGALGYVAPGGDATFSVAIRTAWLDRASGVTEYGVGGGITWDSTTAAEYDEVRAKSAVLTAAPAEPFELIETMRLDAGGYARRERHLSRVLESAKYFGFAADRAGIERALDAHAAQVSERPRRVRLLVARDGAVRVEDRALDERSLAPRVMALAASPVSSDDPFLFHKTTRREAYERHRAEHPDAFDVLLWNEAGELTEFTIGNVVLRLDGTDWTPSRECGLLAGCCRAELLERGEIAERRLTRSDLARAEKVWLINSLRGWVEMAVPDSISSRRVALCPLPVANRPVGPR
ncbi:MAG TPA: chorismate-binding protein, partial [Gemmatimonadaceae bacterium]|nr:chorismate-binding protein [Gemmatimonadaceae bacterium]